MSKFKVGDMVRVKDDSSNFGGRYNGRTGVVTNIPHDEAAVVKSGDVRNEHDSNERGDFWLCFSSDSLELASTDLEARVAALEKLVGLTKAPEYSFGDRVDVLYDGEWRNGVVCGVHPSPSSGQIWCAVEAPHDEITGSDTEFFAPEDIRPRQ